jgi:hypothetical protein
MPIKDQNFQNLRIFRMLDHMPISLFVLEYFNSVNSKIL